MEGVCIARSSLRRTAPTTEPHHTQDSVRPPPPVSRVCSARGRLPAQPLSHCARPRCAGSLPGSSVSASPERKPHFLGHSSVHPAGTCDDTQGLITTRNHSRGTGDFPPYAEKPRARVTSRLWPQRKVPPQEFGDRGCRVTAGMNQSQHREGKDDG